MSRVVLVGTGAMASLFGARLAGTPGNEVTLTGTWRDALEAIDARGITVEDETGRWSVPARAVPLGEPTDPAEIVLVLVKAHQTAAVADAAARALADDGLLLTLQNGLGNHEILSAAAGARRVAVGVTAAGATLLGPGVVRDGGAGPTVLAACSVAVEALWRAADTLEAAGFECRIEADAPRLLWRKLVVNCAINALSACRGVPNGALLEHPETRDLLVAAAREAGAVAAAQGIDLQADPAELAKEGARRTRTNRSSMLQDLERDAPTEVEAINGAVVRAGRSLGVPTPVNEALLLALRQREAAR